MAHSHSSVGQEGCSSTNLLVVQVLPNDRAPEVWCNWDLCEMNDRSSKACFKFCGTLLAKESNTILKNTFLNFAKARKKIRIPIKRKSVLMMERLYIYDVKRVQDRICKFVIQEGLPFDHFDNPRLTKMIRETLLPRYAHTRNRVHLGTGPN
ncbi:hypothetical protein R6Q59_029515 [Mikania micrantha]